MSLKSMSNSDLIAWIESNLKGGPTVKNPVKDAIEENEVAGEDVVQFESFTDFTDLGITSLMARRLFNALKSKFPNEFPCQSNNNNNNNNNNNYNNNAQAQQQAQQQQQQQQAQAQANRAEQANRAGNAIDDLLARNNARLNQRAGGGNSSSVKFSSAKMYIFGSANNNNNNEYRFPVSIFVGNKRKKTKNTFSLKSTVRDLKIEVANNEAGGEPDDVRLTYNAKPLVDNKTLEQCGIINSQCFVHVVIRVHGGLAQATDDEKAMDSSNKLIWNNSDANTRERIPNFNNNKNIQPTLDPDCLTYDDNQNELRVKMPCGHVFAPITIFKWCERTLNVYSKAAVQCPMLKCNKEWKIGDIVSAADLNEDEHASLARILEHRQLMQSGEFKECPHCNGLVEIPDTLYMFRVRCPNKICRGKKDFCWICNDTWKGSGLAICGNSDCHTSKVNDQLKIENCGTTTEVWAHNDVACPKLRACPRCLSIVEYKKACKHMVCWQCKRSFCFICLALAGKEVNGYGKDWACDKGDSYDGKCKLAPVQVLS